MKAPGHPRYKHQQEKMQNAHEGLAQFEQQGWLMQLKDDAEAW